MARLLKMSPEQFSQLEVRCVGAKLERVFEIAVVLNYPVEDLVKLVNLRRAERSED